ncbi:putative aldo/keto reductase [Byssothecium circinans]|uniref:Putative aldo/keto reductase n=1 Tax=Byssothecium circinans TaxID=147558 RepID=A0A6A5TW38_9PLEO|nr:putative aldo/keto reductase [Byssothecium circinans]
MIKCWVKNGHNGFIHRQLYDKGLPTYVQDAFTTLAAYTTSTPAVKETILQIAEERSMDLVRQPAPTTTDLRGVFAHLSRVHALFIYQYIRLFDGSVRLRASAERQLPTLRLWAHQLFETTKIYRASDTLLSSLPQYPQNTDWGADFHATSTLWRLWILTESVRRTHILVTTVANVYQTMIRGWAECTGGGMLTARQGLWEAESAAKWFEMSCMDSPLMVSSLQPEVVVDAVGADEVDAFVKSFWAFFLGSDRIRCWADKGGEGVFLLNAFRARGYTHLDTARDYSADAKGASETRLGLVNAPSTFTIHTKVSSGPGAHSTAKIASSISDSLNALRTKKVETMFLHIPDRTTPFEETARAMDKAWKEGKVKTFGLSNYEPKEGHYNAVVRGAERELFPLLRENGVAFFCGKYSPAVGGLFTDKVATAARWSKDTPIGKIYSAIYSKPAISAAVAKVRDAAKKHGINGHAAAIRWTAFHSILDGEYGDAIIFAVSKVEQLESTLDALEAGALPEDLAEAIGDVYGTFGGEEPRFHL